MTDKRPSLSHAILLSAGINAALVLLVAWALAVNRGLAGPRAAAAAAREPAPAEEEAAEAEVTVVVAPEIRPPAPPPEKRFILAPDDLPDAAPEKEAAFYSDRNLRAATEKAPDPEGTEGLATKDGVDLPLLDLRDAEFLDGGERSQTPPDPAAAPGESAAETADRTADQTETEKRAPSPVVAKSPNRSDETRERETPERETADARTTAAKEETVATKPGPKPELAFRDSAAETPELAAPPEPLSEPPGLLEQPPRLEPSPPPPPPPPASRPPARRAPDRTAETAYRSGQRKTKSLGTISNRADASSVDAQATPEGRFGKVLHSIIEKNWHRRRLSLGGLVNRGMVTVEFDVDRHGRISNVRLANPGEANPVMEDCALTAVIHSKLPPPPPELIERNELNGGKFPVSFSFILY